MANSLFEFKFRVQVERSLAKAGMGKVGGVSVKSECERGKRERPSLYVSNCGWP